jgi:pimeloyl-ACP methyl ester carboxylesterase
MRRALRTDPKQEYFLYVPSRARRGSALFVTVHGISRNVEEHATLFAPYAEKHGVVLVAPFFTRDRNPGYQRLGRDSSRRRADLTLDAIVDEVSASSGADPSRLFLFGFSGGAQFAHRYTLAHPERVARAALGAPGWYTFPDRKMPYPYGLGPSKEPVSLAFEPERFLRVPITVFVGENDTGDYHLRCNAVVNRQQGRNRLDRAQRWVAAMRRAAKQHHLPPLVTCERVPGIEHSFKQFMDRGDLGSRVFRALFDSKPRRWNF